MLGFNASIFIFEKNTATKCGDGHDLSDSITYPMDTVHCCWLSFDKPEFTKANHLVFDRLPSVLAALVPFVSVLDNLATLGVGRATLGKKLCVTLGTKYVSLRFRQRFTCRATQTRRMIGDQKQHLRNVMINIALVIIWWWSFTSKDSRQLSSGTSWNSSQGRW